MKENVMSRDVAVQELNKWYDIIEVPEDMRLDVDFGEEEEEIEEARVEKREKDDMMRERVIRAIMAGNLILNEPDKFFVYTLKYPVTKKESEEVVLSKLIFKNRYKAFELESNMKGIKPDEFMPMTRAYIATLTGESKSILSRMYSRDMDVAQAIYTLFTRGGA